MFTLNHAYGGASPLPSNWLARIASVIARFWSRRRGERHARLTSAELQTLDEMMLKDSNLKRSVTAARPALRIAADFSVLGRIVRAIAAWRARARADAEAERSISCLARLDDHTLRDIGFNRADFYRKGMKPRCYDI
jgi:uncharacterized protein YjiS (DUF1127 family)